MNNKQLQDIRDARFKKGYTIGQLIELYGHEAVLAAFDSNTISQAMIRKKYELNELKDVDDVK